MGAAHSRLACAARSGRARSGWARPDIAACFAGRIAAIPTRGFTSQRACGGTSAAVGSTLGRWAVASTASARRAVPPASGASSGSSAGSQGIAAAIALFGMAAGIVASPVVACDDAGSSPPDLMALPDVDGNGSDEEDSGRSLFSADTLAKAGLPNPGTVSEYQRESSLNVQGFDGFVCELLKNFSGPEGQLQVSQNVSLGRTDVQAGGGTYYHFVATYVAANAMFQGVKTPGATYLMATTKLLDEALDLRFDGQLVPAQDEMSSGTVAATCTGSDYTSELTAGVGGGMGVKLGLNYFQSVTSELALGGSVAWMTAPNQVQCQVLSKYSPDSEHTFFNVLNFPNPNLSSSYVRKIGDKLKLFSELTMMLDANDPLTKVAFGYEYLLRVEAGPPNPKTGQPDNIPYTTVRGQFQHDGTVNVGLEQLTLGGQARLKLSAQMQHARRDYRFGVGLEVNY